jgi:hypothetical protein
MVNIRLVTLTMVAIIASSLLTVAVVTGLSIIEEAYAKQKNVGSGDSANLILEVIVLGAVVPPEVGGK